MISIMSDLMIPREEIRDILRNRLLRMPELLELKGIALAKFLILLSYSYEYLYEGRE